MDIHQFFLGNAFDAYTFFGAHVQKDGSVCFRTLAPNAEKVSLIYEGNDWKEIPMEKTHPGGVYTCIVPDAIPGMMYKYRIYSEHFADVEFIDHCDPYGFGMELRPGTASIIRDTDSYHFQDSEWLSQRGGHLEKPVNIYEVHLGSWKTNPNDPNGWYRYEELAPLLIAYAKKNGYNYIECMPLSEHPADCSWGYQNTGFYSPTARYGDMDGLKKFVDLCHRSGIGVIMDFVPVHFAANADALAKFDGTHLYEYDSDVGQSEWGTCNFNYYRREVCSFLSSAAGLWMDVYHCDGIRMDAISRALYWQGDPNRGVNQGAVNFLRSLNHGLNKRWPTGIYMAEDSTNFLKVTAPTRYDGVGFDYKWDMGWMHDTLDYFATPFGERPNAYGKLLFSMHYFYNELYLLALSHDEVVHGKKTIIDKLWGTYAEKCAQLRTLYFYMYMHPGKKLNFMGNELGHFREWDEKRELDWDLLKYPFHDAFQKYFARLSLVYATEPALFDGEYNPDCFEWVASESCTEGVYAWLRKGRGQNLLCIMNTQDHAHKKFPLYLKFPCSAELVLDTEAAEWGGAHKGRRKLHFHTTDGGVYGRDYTLTVDLPAMGSFLLRLTPEAPNPDAARISANKAMAQKRRTARAKNSSK